MSSTSDFLAMFGRTPADGVKDAITRLRHDLDLLDDALAWEDSPGRTEMLQQHLGFQESDHKRLIQAIESAIAAGQPVPDPSEMTPGWE